MTKDQKRIGLYCLKMTKRISLFLVACVIFFGIVFNLGNISADDFKRMLVRVKNDFSAKDAVAGEITLSDDATMAVSSFKDGVAVVTGDRIRVFDSSGIEFYSNKVTMIAPVCQTSPKRILIYNRGQKTLGVYTSFAQIGSIETEGEIINAQINDSGYVAVACQADGYNSMVSLYNANMKEKYKYYSAEGYITNVSVYGAGKQIACSMLCIGGETCMINCFDTSKEDVLCSVSINSCFVYELKYIAKNKLVAVTDTGWYVIDTKNGAILDSCEYSGASLLCYDIDGQRGVFAFSDNGNKSGIQEINFISGSSKEITVSGKAQSVKQGSAGFGVLSGGRVYCYDTGAKELYVGEHACKSIIGVNSKYAVLWRMDGISFIKI